MIEGFVEDERRKRGSVKVQGLEIKEGMPNRL